MGMKSVKLKLFAILALAVAFVATLGAFLGITVANADRKVSITGASTTLFSASGKAEVWAHKVAGATEEDSKYYSMFVFKESKDAISYKKNLAYKWFYNATPLAEPAEGEEALPTVLTKGEGWLNMELGFELGADEQLGFESFVLTFEGQQYSQTKEGKSVNYVVFKPAADGKHVNVIVTDDSDEESWVVASTATALDVDKIKIEFTARDYDKYLVKISDGTNAVTADADGNALAFNNVGGNYSKYSSSSTTPVTPVAFSVKYPEAEQGEGETTENAYTRMAIYSLNGQSFELSGTTEKDGHASGGTVNDITPPVLCLDKEVTFIKGGSEISFGYTAIDVLTSSSSAKTSYFLLSKQQATDVDFNPENISQEGLYTKVTSGDSQKLIYDVNTYIPKAGTDYNSENYGEDFDVSMALKICLTLTDTATNGVSCDVLLDWYVDEAYLLTIGGYNYIAVGKDEAGATFGYTDTAAKTSNPESSAKWQTAVEEYKTALEAAAEKQQLKAGNKNYFYLPSVDKLLGDNATPYKDLTFNLYYMYEGTSTFQSSTGKAANALSINLAKEGKYVFTVLATDAASNKMYYYKTDADGNPEKVEIGTATSDILNFYNEAENTDFEDTKKYLPWFEFYVNASELSVEDPGEQKTAYVGNTYSSISFTINGVSHSETYNLYLFRNDLYFADTGKVMDYEYFMEHKAELLEDNDSRKWFNEITEDDVYSDYAWNGKNSFVPQIGNSFYLVKCTVKDADDYSDRTQTAYMGILAAPQVRPLEGEDVWLQNNITSVVLLCVAGVSLVGIILLLVIKPKNKGDVDEEYEVLQSKKSKNKKK